MACLSPLASTVQSAALILISAGLYEIRNATRAILRDCDVVQSLIALQARGKTNSSIVQELINLNVGTGSLQQTLQGVFQNASASLSAQSASSNIPSECQVQAKSMDGLSFSNPNLTAWFQKCFDYVAQWAMKDLANWNQDSLKTINVRAMIC